jgi:hypothetical protein
MIGSAPHTTWADTMNDIASEIGVFMGSGGA